MNENFQKILPFILAILLIFIAPMLASRHGMSYGEFIRSLFTGFSKKPYGSGQRRKPGEKGREPLLRNGRKNELMELLSALIAYAGRTKQGLVYPGSLRLGQKTAGFFCIYISDAEIFGINCFGFGGRISGTREQKRWIQQMNGKTQEILNPVLWNQESEETLREILKEEGLEAVPLSVISVFTNPEALLYTEAADSVMSARDLLALLKQRTAPDVPRIDPRETARRIHRYLDKTKGK